MRSFSKIVFLVFLAVFLVSGSAMALSFGQDYWTLSDKTTGDDGNASFTITFEEAWYESDFGLYTVTDYTNADLDSVELLKIFDKNEEPSNNTRSLNFSQNNGIWTADLYATDYINGVMQAEELISSQNFDIIFGFYYGIYTGGPQDNSLDYYVYTDSSLNADGQEHIGTTFNENSHIVSIQLDDQMYPTSRDLDFNDMTVQGRDLAPVPEPATLFLLGSGLLGFAGIRRKKAKE